MKIKELILLCLPIPMMGWLGCDGSDALSFEDLDTSPGYFVECYLTPGEVYKLSVTRISALNEDFVLDYSADFTITIDSVNLFQSLYSENGSNYIYNYGNADEFSYAETIDTVRLQIINAENDTLRSFTTIPDPIKVNQTDFYDDRLLIHMMPSKSQIHDYYLLKIDLLKQNEKTSSLLKYYDLSKTNREQSELVIEYKWRDKPLFDFLNVELYRVTEANFRYQLSLWNAENANKDNLVFPNPLEGNIENGIGIFTCYSKKTFRIEF